MRSVVTLVHGTWARGYQWPEMRKFLNAHLEKPVRIDTFDWPVDGTSRWSAKNRADVRTKAASDLRLHLDARLAEHPAARHFIVAHSHGGTIVLSALRNYPQRSRIAGVACLSTPFINVRMRSSPAARLLHLSAGLATLGWASGLIAGARSDLPEMGIWLLFLGWPLFLLAATLALSYVRRTAVHLCRQSRLPRPFPDLHVLILRSPADETSFALATAQAGLWLLRTLARRFESFGIASIGVLRKKGQRVRNRDVIRVSIALGLIEAILLGGLFGLFSWDAAGSVISGIFDIISIHPMVSVIAFWVGAGIAVMVTAYATGIVAGSATSVLVFPLVPLAAMTLVPFGGPLFAVTAPFLDISVEPVPTGEWLVNQLPGPSGSKGLKHSLTHSSLAALEALGEWLRTIEREVATSRP